MPVQFLIIEIRRGNSKQCCQFDAGGKLLSPENLLPGMGRGDKIRRGFLP